MKVSSPDTRTGLIGEAEAGLTPIWSCGESVIMVNLERQVTNSDVAGQLALMGRLLEVAGRVDTGQLPTRGQHGRSSTSPFRSPGSVKRRSPVSPVLGPG